MELLGHRVSTARPDFKIWDFEIGEFSLFENLVEFWPNFWLRPWPGPEQDLIRGSDLPPQVTSFGPIWDRLAKTGQKWLDFWALARPRVIK